MQVCSVEDQYSLQNFNRTYLTYEFRSNTTNPNSNVTYFETDHLMNSRWLGFSLPVKAMAFIPTLLSFLCFGILIWYFGRWKPSPTDPHGGRLKKRKKNRFSRILQRFSRRKSAREDVTDMQVVNNVE